MKRRQIFSAHSREHEHWEDFWLALLQQYREQHTADDGSASAAQTPRPGTEGSSGDLAGTAVVTIPFSTKTVDTTIWSTTVVTVHIGSATHRPTNLDSNPDSTQTSVARSRTTSGKSDVPASDQPSTSVWRDLPPLVTAESDNTLPAIVRPTGNLLASPLPTHNATESNLIEDKDMPQSQKRAIVGGLSGTIAGLVLIGFLIFFILRRRRNRRDAKGDFDEASLNEKGIRPELVKKWTSFVSVIPVGGGSPRHTQQRPPSMTPAVDEDHRIIRMSTRHWPRPFASGEGEGYRDSVAPGRLRVMNPDVSRPTSPRRSGDTSKRASLAGSLSGFIFGARSSRNGPPSQQQQQAFAHSVPTITVIDPALSRECIAPYAASSPSFRSYPSLISLPTIRQSPPEDPFLTPPDEAELRLGETPSSAPPTRSGLRTAAGDAATKTWNQLGSLLHPFRSQAIEHLSASEQQSTRDPGLLHRSMSSTLSSTFSSRPRSDPFDLDRPSVRGSSEPFGERNVHTKVYEGT